MAKRSPCYECHMLRQPKNNEVCGNCKLRLKYLQELGIAGDFEKPEMEYSVKKQEPETRKEDNKMPDEKKKNPTPEPDQSADTDLRLELDFNDYPEVLAALPQAARIHIRTMTLQAIAYIVEGLKKDGLEEEKKAA